MQATGRGQEIVVVGLCGSVRSASYNRGLLHAATELLPSFGARLEVPDLRGLPEFDEDLQMNPPSRVLEVRARIAAAEILLFATPEYNYGLPGWFKNVIDWLSRPVDGNPFMHKPTGIISASFGERGGARAQMALRQSLVPLDNYTMPRPEMFVGNAATKTDVDGRLTDEATRRELADYLRALLTWAKKVRT